MATKLTEIIELEDAKQQVRQSEVRKCHNCTDAYH